MVNEERFPNTTLFFVCILFHFSDLANTILSLRGLALILLYLLLEQTALKGLTAWPLSTGWICIVSALDSS